MSIGVPLGGASAASAAPAARAAAATSLTLAAEPNGFALLGDDGSVVFRARGANARARCLAWAAEAGTVRLR